VNSSGDPVAKRERNPRLTRLVETSDDHFAWMLGERPRFDELSLPWDGLDEPHVIRYLRRAAAELRVAACRGSWMIVDGVSTVGLCSFKSPPGPARTVEIGYGVAAEHRGRGHATRAVAQMLAEARANPLIEALTAETAVDNMASQIVLQRNGFSQVGWRADEAEGDVYLWRIGVASGRSRPHPGSATCTGRTG
jgi:RimJ/RimL family protein N-acetyltransferase